MGRIYFNKKTGEFFEATFKRRSPPEGFEYTGYNKDHRYKPHYWVGDSYYCPDCRKYHPIIHLYSRFLNLYDVMTKRFGAKYGCRDAKRMITLGRYIGGRKKSYELVEKLMETGHFLEFYEMMYKNIPGRVLSKAIRAFLKSGSIDEAKATIVAEFI